MAEVESLEHRLSHLPDVRQSVAFLLIGQVPQTDRLFMLQQFPRDSAAALGHAIGEIVNDWLQEGETQVAAQFIAGMLAGSPTLADSLQAWAVNRAERQIGTVACRDHIAAIPAIAESGRFVVVADTGHGLATTGTLTPEFLMALCRWMGYQIQQQQDPVLLPAAVATLMGASVAGADAVGDSP